MQDKKCLESSLNKVPLRVDTPLPRVARRRARLVMLLEPGTVTVIGSDFGPLISGYIYGTEYEEELSIVAAFLRSIFS